MSVRLSVVIRYLCQKSPSPVVSLFRVSSILVWLIFKSVWLDTIMNGVFSVFPEESLWTRFLTTPFDRGPHTLQVFLIPRVELS